MGPAVRSVPHDREAVRDQAMHDAAKDFQAAFIVAQLDLLRALPIVRVPGTGRERNVVYDAGDAIECLQRAGVDLYRQELRPCLSGHRLRRSQPIGAGAFRRDRRYGRAKSRPVPDGAGHDR